MIENVSSLVQYLPPYSPDLNSIESALSNVKLELQQSELENNDATDIGNIATTNIYINNTRKL